MGYLIEPRLQHLSEWNRLWRCRRTTLDAICSAPIETTGWGIAHLFPGRTSVALFEALEQYRSYFGRHFDVTDIRADAVTHTIWLFEALDRIAHATDPASAIQLFRGRGSDDITKCSSLLVKLNYMYWELTDLDRIALFIAAILHDVGKATGTREKHPQRGLAQIRSNPIIKDMAMRALPPHLLPHLREELWATVETLIEGHDLIGTLAITKHGNPFDFTRTLTAKTTDPQARKRLLSLLTIISIADIDAQGKNGLFSCAKLESFYAAYVDLRRRLDDAGIDAQAYAAWGRARVLAWARGDYPQETDEFITDLLRELMPREEDRLRLFMVMGRLREFDGIFYLSTATHHPRQMLALLIWVSKLIERHEIDTISFDSTKTFKDVAATVQALKPAISQDALDAYFELQISGSALQLIPRP